jgi:hypothetical protein
MASNKAPTYPTRCLPAVAPHSDSVFARKKIDKKLTFQGSHFVLARLAAKLKLFEFLQD